MTTYSFNQIFESFSKKNGKKRTVFNLGPLGGINSTLVILIFMSLPFIEFAILFNPIVFEFMGIVSSIVFFIVFLSMIMILIGGLIFVIRSSVIRKITPSWNTYFEGRDINLVLSSGITPYSDFFKYYEEFVAQNLSDDEMQKALLKAFITMEEENSDLISAMNRNKKLD